MTPKPKCQLCPRPATAHPGGWPRCERHAAMRVARAHVIIRPSARLVKRLEAERAGR